MKYRRFPHSDCGSSDIVENILLSRGVNNVPSWLNAENKLIVSHWSLLDRIENAAHIVMDSIEDEEDAVIVVDCDVDGYTSAAIIHNFFNHYYPEWTNDHLSYIHHAGKQHGLADIQELIGDNIRLIICPDSASNDYDLHEDFVGRSNIVILDHHEADHVSESINTFTVNNQLCDYPNKDLSGAGIAWLFCKAFEELYALGDNYSKQLIDLCALGNCADMMDYKSIETKSIIDNGFKNIVNPFFKGMVEKNDYSIQRKGGINYMSIAFYVVPFINAVCRTGTQEDKDILFKSMCEKYANEQVVSHKRGAFGEYVPLWEEAIRIATNVKNKQGRLQDEGLSNIENKIKTDNLLSHKVLVCCCEPGECEPNVRGLIANKLQAKYQRPSLVLTKAWDSNINEYVYSGSMRNYSMSEIQNFKDLIEESGYSLYATGHQGAAGTSIREKDVDSFVSWMDCQYSNVSSEPVYYVDYIWNARNLDKSSIAQIANMSNCWGQGCQESMVAVEDVYVKDCSVSLIGAKENTISITLPNGIEFMKFFTDRETYNSIVKDKDCYITIVGTCNLNNYDGNIKHQIIIEDFNIEKKWVF